MGSHWADATSTPSYSSDLHFSVFQDRSETGALQMFYKMFDKVLKFPKKVENDICPISVEIIFRTNLRPMSSTEWEGWRSNVPSHHGWMYALNLTNLRFCKIGPILSSGSDNYIIIQRKCRSKKWEGVLLASASHCLLFYSVKKSSDNENSWHSEENDFDIWPFSAKRPWNEKSILLFVV